MLRANPARTYHAPLPLGVRLTDNHFADAKLKEMVVEPPHRLATLEA